MLMDILTTRALGGWVGGRGAGRVGIIAPKPTSASQLPQLNKIMSFSCFFGRQANVDP